MSLRRFVFAAVLWVSLAGPALAQGPATRPAGEIAAAATRPATCPAVFPASSPALRTDAPKTVDELRALEARVQAACKKGLAATVGVIAGGGQGSGVIISPDGYVLTAGHVSGAPNRDVTVILPDGRRVKARTLGANSGIDSGLVKIVEKGPFPFVELTKSSDLRPGMWCVAIGHPGGWRKDRPAVLRAGRILSATDRVITTDCTLVGGDSGGPLFDLDGRVIGIHSRIGPSTSLNMHVPVDSYVQTWERLAAGEAWGSGLFGQVLRPGPAMLGVTPADDERGARVEALTPDGPAQKAGLKPGDVITAVNGQKVANAQALFMLIAGMQVGQSAKVSVIRGGETLELTARLARRPGA